MKYKQLTKLVERIGNIDVTWYQNVDKNGNLKGGYHFIQRERWQAKNTFTLKKTGMGMCLFCKDIDWKHLEEHHPDKEKMPDFTITLCANCHRDVHYLNGSKVNEHKKHR